MLSLTAVTRGIGRWYDLEPGGQATRIFLLLFVAAWTTFHIIAYLPIDLHSDLTEMYAWGRHPSAGYFKHPPLVGWVSAAWFAVFPAADWSFHLLAMCNAALGLYATNLIARRYLSGDKRLLVLLLLLLMPFYNFHGQRISTNQLLLSAWPLATHFFLRAFEARAWHWSAAAGLFAGFAMLAKYYSIYLIAAFVIAALSHPARWRYLKSPSPWISAAAGLAVLAPHLIWLGTAEFGPFKYAYVVHGGLAMPQMIGKSANYVLGAIGYAALACIVYALAVRANRRALAQALWPADPDRRMLVILLAAMLWLPPLTSPLLGLEVTPLWTMSAFFLLPIVLLAPQSVALPRSRAIGVAVLVAATCAGPLLAAPVVAWKKHTDDQAEGRAYHRLVAEELDRRWRAISTQPLRIVLGAGDVGQAMTFYHPDRPDAVTFFQMRLTPWITMDRVKREGWAAVCAADYVGCVDHVLRFAGNPPDIRRSETEVARRFLGQAGKPARFTIILMPPQPETPR